MRRTALLAVVLAACATDEAPLDLAAPLGPDESRAGVLADPAALTGGLMAEARPGDVLLRNDRVRFVLQGLDHATGGLASLPGGVIDADVVRDDGSADVDLVVDWLPALDVGWLASATAIDVIDDGVASGEAVVRVTATDAGFAYLDGVLETPGLRASRGLSLVTTYTLAAGSPLLHVTTTVTAGDAPLTVRPGDILHTLPGLASGWVPGLGRTTSQASAQDGVMLVHDELGLAYGLFADDADASASPERGLDLLNFLIALTSLYEPAGELAPGESRTWSRWWGVAAEPADLTDAWLARTGAATRAVEGRVAGPDGPVAGARVTAVVDGAPFSLAISDADGRVALDVPADGEVRLVADGAGSRLVDDLPVGASTGAPLAHADRRASALAALRDGATGRPHARGWGRAEGAPGDTLTLPAPGFVRVSSGLADTFEVRLRRLDGPVPDDALGLAPPGGLAALGHARGGALTLPVEPGRYGLLAWRGVRWEVHEAEVDVVAGQTTDVALDALVPALDAPGWWVADTHSHAAPSFDGKLSPADRALVAAATGLDLWIASEHDVVVDHGPVVEALGLSDTLRVVGAVEVTPWVRGHVNLFPVRSDPDARAGGAWAWWEELAPTTTEQFERLAAHHAGALVQVNHPFSPGLPSFAGWEPGLVRSPSFWWDGFDALEVVVPGQDPRGLALYTDLAARGILSAATGSSDSHDHLQNDPGLLVTWIHAPGAASAGALTDDAIRGAFAARATVASNGAFLELDPLPGSTVPAGTTVSVQARGPSWIRVDRVNVWQDGVLARTVALDDEGRAAIRLDAEADASVVLEGLGDTPMAPLSGRGAWVVASAYQVDVGDDGWSPPLGPLLGP